MLRNRCRAGVVALGVTQSAAGEFKEENEHAATDADAAGQRESS